MDEIGIVTSFNPLDALESISKIYNTRQLSKVEILKIQAQAKSFNRWLLEQRNENKEIRTDILASIESYRKHPWPGSQTPPSGRSVPSWGRGTQ